MPEGTTVPHTSSELEQLQREIAEELAQPDFSVGEALEREVVLYVQVRAHKEELQAQLKSANQALEDQTLRLHLVMESANMKSFIHSRLGRFTRKVTPYTSIKDEELLTKFLESKGLLGRFRKLAWKVGDINAYIKDLRQAGEQLPEGVRVWDKKTITWTPKRPAADAQILEQED